MSQPFVAINKVAFKKVPPTKKSKWNICYNKQNPLQEIASEKNVLNRCTTSGIDSEKIAVEHERINCHSHRKWFWNILS